MKSPLLRLAIGIVRAWTRFYTWRMPPALRDSRRAEIDSDLWEFGHDVTAHGPLGPSAHLLLRLLSGIPDDFAWRVEQDVPGDKRLRRAAALTATAFFVVAFWMFNSFRPPELPRPPSPLYPLDVELPAPPPPPPPPPRPIPRQ